MTLNFASMRPQILTPGVSPRPDDGELWPDQGQSPSANSVDKDGQVRLLLLMEGGGTVRSATIGTDEYRRDNRVSVSTSLF